VRLVDGVLPAFATHEVAKGGSTLLKLQADCPFRAGVELRLGARELEQPAADIEPTERGQLAHALLEAFWRDVRDHATLAAMSPGQRLARLAALAGELFGPLLAEATDVRRELLTLEQRSTIARAGELLERDLLRAPFTVAELETAHVVDVGGVQVRVVVDRVDRLVDGSLAFIDYKTGADAKPGAWMKERPESPQLPLYVRTAGTGDVGAVAFGVLRKGETRYAGYSRDAAVFDDLRPFDATRAPFREYADWKTLLATWQQRLDALGAEHARGEARLAPDPRRACQYCHLPVLCRSGQALLAVEENADARE
jgi:RecB family exonuclease